ncbi:hypothetical protein EMCRGX_G029822 [Ephydatia muelleri]
MAGVASGFVLGRAHSGPGIVVALMESRHSYGSNISLFGCGLVRVFTGLVFLVMLKMAAAFLCKKVLYFMCQLVGLEPVCEKRKSVVTSEKIHYSTSFVVLDHDVAGEDNTHDNKTVLNLDIPVKFLAYLSMGFAAVNLVPAIFHMLNI